MKIALPVYLAIIAIGLVVAGRRGEKDEACCPQRAASGFLHSERRRIEDNSPCLGETPRAAVPARGAWDFTGPENHDLSERTLSVSVDPGKRAAIDAAWRAKDFARAASLAAELPELDDRRQILLPLVTAWASAQPHGAAQFAQALAAGVERREVLEIAIRSWVGRDLVAASAWLNALEPHPDHDLAIVAIATTEILAASQPEIALSWAESVTAPTLRWEAICTVAQTWARRDVAAATRYVESTVVLSDEERQRMLAHVRRQVAVLE